MKSAGTTIRTAGWLAAVVVGMALVAPVVRAQAKWEERTVLRFDRPVMVPGKTLQPGTYVFELADSQSNRNIMQIYTANPDNPTHEDNLVATTLTVPMRRNQPNGDVVLKFAETTDDANSPVALKGFFYPGTMYGHQFVYRDAEAQQIARQTHTLVLSRDVPGSDLDMQSGTLHNLDANGNRTAWRENPDVAREWAAWIVTWQPAHNAQASHARNTDRDQRNHGVSATRDERNPARSTTGDDVVGTSGRTGTTFGDHNVTSGKTSGSMTAQDHAQAIQRLVDQALDGSHGRVTVDRATLEQIRQHAAAIERGGHMPGTDRK